MFSFVQIISSNFPSLNTFGERLSNAILEHNLSLRYVHMYSVCIYVWKYYYNLQCGFFCNLFHVILSVLPDRYKMVIALQTKIEHSPQSSPVQY